ncbi:MAG: PEGA domain-containing protein, partial [Fibrobacteria bacterium]|nr:PEGA domain-containing protein [Fibrobacteria bacterium]
MKMFLITPFILLAFIILSYPLEVIGEEMISVAVVDFDGKGVQQHEAEIITDKFRGQLLQTGLFAVVERNKMKALLQEQDFQTTDRCDGSACIVEMGKLLSVQKMFTGSAGKIGNLFILSINVIDVESGKILLTLEEEIKGSIEDVFKTAVPTITGKIKKEMAVINEGLAYLTITSHPKGAAIKIDGADKGASPLTKLELKEGNHQVIVSLADYVSQEKHISIRVGKIEKMHFNLKHSGQYLSRKRHESAEKKSTLAKGTRWILGGLTVIGLGSAGYFHYDAWQKHKDYKANSNPDLAVSLWDAVNTAKNNRNIS